MIEEPIWGIFFSKHSIALTDGYGERGLENPETDSALTSVLGTAFIWGVASAFCTLVAVAADSELTSAGAGRVLLGTGDGRRAFPICWNYQVIVKKRDLLSW